MRFREREEVGVQSIGRVACLNEWHPITSLFDKTLESRAKPLTAAIRSSLLPVSASIR
jgi:hypothetical protein